jgi:hypothetical protein
MNYAPPRHQGIPLRPDFTAHEREGLRSLVRACIATGAATLDRSVNLDNFVRHKWAGDRDVTLLLRSAVAPLTLAGSSAFANIATTFLRALTPVSAAADLLGRVLSLEFGGATQINCPGIALPVADFVAEGAPIPVQRATTSAGPTLEPHKLAVITTLTNETLQSANAEALVRQALIESTGPALDAVLFSAAAAGPDRPAGLLNGIAALTPAAAGAKEQAMVDDLANIATAVAPVAGNGGIVLVVAPSQGVALALRLAQRLPYAVMVSSSLAAGTVIGVATNGVVTAAQGAPQIDASKQVVIQEETTPSALMTGPTRSLFQTDSAALRLRWPITWARRDVRAVAWMAGVSW